jgi:hypothetical protein
MSILLDKFKHKKICKLCDENILNLQNHESYLQYDHKCKIACFLVCFIYINENCKTNIKILINKLNDNKFFLLLVDIFKNEKKIIIFLNNFLKNKISPKLINQLIKTTVDFFTFNYKVQPLKKYYYKNTNNYHNKIDLIRKNLNNLNLLSNIIIKILTNKSSKLLLLLNQLSVNLTN